MRYFILVLMCGLLAGCGLIRSDSSATRDSLLVVINYNEVGVVFNMLSGELGDPLGPGTYVINPFTQEVTVYFIGQQEYTMRHTEGDPQPHGDSISTRSSDGQEIYVDVSVLYSIDPANVNIVHERLQNRYAENFIRPTLRGVMRETVATFTAEQLYGEARATLEADAQERVAELMEEQGFILVDLLVRDIIFTAEFAQSMESTLIAEQNELRTATAAAQITATPSP
ncbi:MAG: prohibitin family protein [Aggregatilineales bacterium]